MNFKQWLLLTEAKKSSDIARELLGNNETLFNQIKDKIPKDIKPDIQAKLLPIAAYYYKKQQQPDLKTLEQDIKDYAELVIKQKMPIITVNDDLTISNEFKDYLYWTQIIHGKQAEDRIINAPIPQGDLKDQKIIAKSKDRRIKVYKANSMNQCIILGKGEIFCISRPGPSNRFQAYRDDKVSTFYFVYDNTRTDDLAIVVVDATNYGIEITDRKNETAETMQDPYSNTPKRIESDPELYFKYLKQHGIDTSVFKNIPKNRKEEAEQRKLGLQKHDLQWFISLTLDEKSKYIGRGHLLSNEQFDYLYDNKFMLLLTQYVRTGRKVNDYQLQKIAKIRDLKDKYLHNRLIEDQHDDILSKQEYELLSPKQKEEFHNVDDADKKLKKAIQIGDLEKTKEAIKDGAEIPDIDLYDTITYDPVSSAAEFGHFEIVKYLVEKEKATITSASITLASANGNLDVIKYLIKKNAEMEHYAEINDYAVSLAADNGHLNVVKYLLGNEIKDEKGNIIKLPNGIKTANIDDNAVEYAAKSGHLDIVKYLIEKGANIDHNIYYAAENGHLDIVKYLIEKGANIDDTIYYAAENGHLDIVKYLLGDEVKDNKGNIIKLPNSVQPANIDDYAVSVARTKEIKDYLIKKSKRKTTK